MKRIKCTCPICNKTFTLMPANYRAIIRRNGRNPCCSQACGREQMKRRPHNNIDRVKEWVSLRQPGESFRANTIGKELNLTTSTVSSVLKWQDNIRAEYKMGSSTMWVKV